MAYRRERNGLDLMSYVVCFLKVEQSTLTTDERAELEQIAQDYRCF